MIHLIYNASQLYNLFLFLFFSFLFTGCNKSENSFSKKQIPEKYFNIKYTEISDSNSKHNSMKYNGYFGEYNLFTEFHKIISYSNLDTYHIFKNDDLEIQFPTVRFQTNANPHLSCLIGCKDIINIDQNNNSEVERKSYYIIWLNNSKINDYNARIEEWGIGKCTDTIYSNIDKKDIFWLFPKFNGKVIEGKVKEIIVNNNFKTDDWWFYQEIQFIGFDRYFDGYKHYKDSLKKIGIDFP
jgi:hypothetical protein